MATRELTSASPRAPQPPGARVDLRPHQLALLHACRAFEANNIPLSDDADQYVRSRVGVIGDKVGAGKSYVMLALMLSPLPRDLERHKNLKSYANNMVQVVRKHALRDVDACLLVVPHNLAHQWHEYFEAFLPAETRTLVVNRARVLDAVHDIGAYDVVLVTSTFYGSLLQRVGPVRWKRVLFDEVDSLKMHDCAYVDAYAYWFVTASFANVLHPTGNVVLDRATGRHLQLATGLHVGGFVKRLFVELARGLDAPTFRMLLLRNADAFVDESAQLPPVRETTLPCLPSREVRILHGIVDHHVIAHLNANDLRGAVSCVSPMRRSNEANIVALLIESLDRTVRNLDIKAALHRTMEYEDEHAREHELARLAVKRDEAVQRIAAIRERITTSGTCPICYDDIAQKSILPCCQNAFCFRCISLWLAQQRTCPMCKAASGIASMYVVAADASAEPAAASETPEPKTKMATLLDVVTARLGEGGAKIIVFSAYDNTVGQIGAHLEQHGVTCARLHGNGAHIATVLRRYRAADSGLNVLLANAADFGSGLNMENTTDVVLFHRFDSEVERQVIGRAQRPGRSAPLRVWYLLYPNELQGQVS